MGLRTNCCGAPPLRRVRAEAAVPRAHPTRSQCPADRARHPHDGRVSLLDRATIDGIPTVSATTGADRDRVVHDGRRLTTALDSALRDGKRATTSCTAGSPPYVTRPRRNPTLLAVIDGSRSPAARTAGSSASSSGSSTKPDCLDPSTQQVLSSRGDRLIRVDFRFPGTPVVVETLGYRWHRSAGQMGIDTQRLNRLLLDGFVPLQFTYDRIVSDGEGAVAEVREALRPLGFHVSAWTDVRSCAHMNEAPPRLTRVSGCVTVHSLVGKAAPRPRRAAAVVAAPLAAPVTARGAKTRAALVKAARARCSRGTATST